MVRHCAQINYMCCRVMEGREKILASERFIRHSSQHNFYFYIVTGFIMKIWLAGVLMSEYESKRSHRGILPDKVFKKDGIKYPPWCWAGVWRGGTMLCHTKAGCTWVVPSLGLKMMSNWWQSPCDKEFFSRMNKRQKACKVFFFFISSKTGCFGLVEAAKIK